jgi:hypothetical protein
MYRHGGRKVDQPWEDRSVEVVIARLEGVRAQTTESQPGLARAAPSVSVFGSSLLPALNNPKSKQKKG